jgi:hypothetical protein
MQIKKKTIQYKRIYKRFIIEQKFDPYNPSEELMDELSKWQVPTVNYISSKIHGKRFVDLDQERLYYVAFEMVRGLPEYKLVAKLLYTIKYYTNKDDINSLELYNEITGEDGFISAMYMEHMREEAELENIFYDVVEE